MAIGRRWLHFLPALAVLGSVAAVVLPPLLRGVGDLRRETAELEVALCRPSERPRVVKELFTFAERHRDDPDATWLALELMIKAKSIQGAVQLWSEDEGRRGSPAAAKRLAALVLRHAGREPCVEPLEPTSLFPRCVQARLEIRDGDASAELDRVTGPLAVAGVLSLYAPIHRTPSPARDRLATALRVRTDDPEIHAAGVVLAAKPGALELVPVLRERITSPWRLTRPYFFQHLAVALGVIGGDEVRAFLAERRAWEALEGGDADRRRALAYDVALALAGDADARERVYRAAEAERADAWAVHRLALGLCTLVAHGRADAADALRATWDRLDDPESRLQIAIGTMLADPAPPSTLPLDAWATELATQGNLVAPTVAHAWALRRGRPGAAEALVLDALGAARTKDVAAPDAFDDDATAAFFEALRALVRWG